MNSADILKLIKDLGISAFAIAAFYKIVIFAMERYFSRSGQRDIREDGAQQHREERKSIEVSAEHVAMLARVQADLIEMRAGIQRLEDREIVRSEKTTRLEAQMEDIRMYLFRRGVSDGLVMGVIAQNSPLSIVSGELRERFEPLKADLQVMYQNAKVLYGVSDLDDHFNALLAMEIERRFGHRIVQDICFPMGLREGACLVAALIVARNGDLLNFSQEEVNIISQYEVSNSSYPALSEGEILESQAP